MKQKILFVTGPEEKCGIYQYGYSVYKILEQYSDNDVKFYATDFGLNFSNSNNSKHFHYDVNEYKPDVIIYNHHPWTLRWLDNGITRTIKNMTKIVQIVLTGHEHIDEFIGVDSYIMTNPNYEEDGRYFSDGCKTFSAIPPIIYFDDIKYRPYEKGTIQIGTSGIGNKNKESHNIIGLINEQFTEDVILNVHITNGYYVDSSGKISNEVIDHYRSLAKSNIDIRVNQNFLSNHELVQWLNKNDINIYWYANNNNPGVSSSIDRALAAKQPIGVNPSNFFEHVINDKNDLAKVSIKDIIAYGQEPLFQYYEKWSPYKLVEKYQSIINKSRRS